jgi:serine/threonine protein kinase
LAKDLHQDNWSTFKRLFRLLVNSLNNNTILIQYLKYDLFNLLKLHGWINTKYVLTKEKTQLLAEPGKTQLLAEPGLYTQYFPTNTAIDGDAVNPAQNWLYEGKKLPNSEIYSLFYQVAYVLSQIRDIFQHNDLKVDNILVYKLARPITFSLGGFEFSTYCVAKLIDYGVANKKETSDNTYCNRIYNMMLEMKFIDEDKHEAIMKQLKSQSLDVVWNDLLTYLKKNLSRVLTEKMIICNGTDDVKIQNFQPQRLHHPHWRSGGNKRLLKVTRKRRRFTKKN